MNKYFLIIIIVLLFVFSVSTAEARRTSFRTKSYTPKIKTYTPKYTVPKVTNPRNYKNGGQLKIQNGYFKKNGTYVQPHLKTKPDNTTYNNRKYILGF